MIDQALIVCAIVSCVGTAGLIILHSSGLASRNRPQRVEWDEPSDAV